MRVSLSVKKFPVLKMIPDTAIKALVEMAVDEFLSSAKGTEYCAVFKIRNNNPNEQPEDKE